MQPMTALSVTEAELNSRSNCEQDMMFVKRIVESVELRVKLPVILEVNNKGVVDLVNNWSISGRTCHINTQLNFMRELKEEGALLVKWILMEENCSDMFAKNLQGPLFQKHLENFMSDEA